MNDYEKLSVSFHTLLMGFRDTLSLPTDSTLEKCLKLSAVLTVLTAVLKLIGIYTFLSWQGCLFCTAILVTLLWIERSENDALLRMYSNARVSAQKAAQYAKSASSSISSKRRSTGNNSSGKKTSKPKQRTNNEQN